MNATPREVRSYETEGGRVPFDEWLSSLRDRKAAAKIKARLKRVAEYGNLGDWKQLKGTRIFEFRIGGSSGYRVYFGDDEEAIVLLLGGDKDSQKRDILKAEEFWADYEQRQDTSE